MRELDQILRSLDNPINFMCQVIRKLVAKTRVTWGLNYVYCGISKKMLFFQSFGLNTSDRDQLDSFLLSVFQKNLPPNFNLLNPCIPVNKTSACKFRKWKRHLSEEFEKFMCSIFLQGNEEFPTLLHFTAKYGLEKLSWQLLESPGGEQACQVRNSSHLTPTEIAERANHSKLANVLKNYMVRCASRKRSFFII